MNKFVVGDRVITCRGELGHVENIIDDMFADVRYLTPNNKPSCCVGLVWLRELTHIGENVVPIQKNKEWWEEANRFYGIVKDAIEDFS